jgi:NAD(P)-dependent dehydrogenase (short-subunit alcohol dehydrogenase family)
MSQEAQTPQFPILPDAAADAFSIRGKVVIVTGVAGNIGPRIARVFALNGAKVLASDRPGEGLDRALAELKAAGHDVASAPADLTVPDELRSVIQRAEDTHGRLDGIVCCGGIGRSGTLDEDTDENFDTMFHTNLRSMWLLVRYARALLAKSGGGSVVGISSVNGHRALFPCALYTATKSGMLAMCREMAVELAPQQIRINSVSPGSIPSPERHLHHMAERLHEPFRTQYLDMARPLMQLAGIETQPLAVPARGEDIAMACLYLLSPAARFVTGADLLVDGGMLQDYTPHMQRGSREGGRPSFWHTVREWLFALPETAWKEGIPHWMERWRRDTERDRTRR